MSNYYPRRVYQQLPSSSWCRANAVTHPLRQILAVYRSDLTASDTYCTFFYTPISKDGYTLGATGLCTSETWTLADLREATPDEAEAQHYRRLEIDLHAARETN